MRNRTLLLLVLLFAPALPMAGQAQTAEPNEKAELAGNFVTMHSNAPVGGCGCFWNYGGGGTFALTLRQSQFAVVGDISSAVSNSITSSKFQLTMTTFTGGVRYTPAFRLGPVHPFAQTTAGLVHALGTLAAGASNSSAGFAYQAGGGADLDLSHRFRWRIGEADYLLTTFNNGSNNHQNNLRISSGIVWRF
jgi:outer membrane immunogenic protein